MEHNFLNDDMDEFYMDLPSPTSSEVITPLKCCQRFYEPSFLLSEIWIPKSVLLNRKLSAINKNKIHILHTLEKPEVASFSTYDEIEESDEADSKETDDNEIFYSDTDEEPFDYEPSRCPDSGTLAYLQSKFVEEYDCGNGHTFRTKAQNDPSSHDRFHLEGLDSVKVASCDINSIQETAKLSYEDLNCSKDFDSHNENYDNSNNQSITDGIHLANSLKNLLDTVSNLDYDISNEEIMSYRHEKTKNSVCSLPKESPALVDSNDNDTTEDSKLNKEGDCNALEERDYYVLVKPKLNTEKIVKHHKRKTKKAAPTGYNQLNLHNDEDSANYFNQCEIDAAERFRQRALGIFPQENNFPRHHNPREFPELPTSTYLFHHNNVSKKSTEEHKLELSFKDISDVITESNEADNTIENNIASNIPSDVSSPISRDTLIIENIPLNVDSVELENWLNGYGEVYRLSLIPNGHICRAELEIDADLAWMVDTLNETQPFGACSDALKCHILRK